MNRLTWTAAAVALWAGFAPAISQAQNSTTPNRNTNLATTFLNPWSNPMLSQYQRQRELREKRDLERSIEQLQRLEILRMGRTRQQAAPADSADDTPHGSTKFKKPSAAGTPKKPMKPTPDKAAGDKMDKAKSGDTTPGTEGKRLLNLSERSGGPSRAFSNYSSLLRKQ